MLKFSQKAQSTLEYALLIFLILAALLATQTYIKRGLQGKFRESADQMGGQYSPGYTTSNISEEEYSNTTETVNDTVSTSTINKSSRSRTGGERLEALQNEWYPNLED